MMRGVVTRFLTINCVIAATVALPLVAIGDDALPYMARIAVERASAETAVSGDSVHSILHVDDPATSITALSEVNGLQIVGSDRSTVSVVFERHPTMASEPGERHRKSTFVIDFDEAPVQTLKNDLRAKLERRPTADEIVAYVHAHIDDKSYSRAFDLASRVAETGKGDCTEHAVLLAALARANGYSARVTFGALLFNTKSESFAFGHAWAEIYDGDRWQIKDATLPTVDRQLEKVRYLPVSAFDEEGPGYGYAMMYMLHAMPTKITVLGNLE